MESKRGVYRSEHTVSTQANELEAVLVAHQLDPLGPESWPIWDAWALDGLAGALDKLAQCQVTGETTMPPKKSVKGQTLDDLRAQVAALRAALHQVYLDLETLVLAFKTARHTLGTSSDARQVHAARAQMTLAQNARERLEGERKRIAHDLQTAEPALSRAEHAVHVARANLGKLTTMRDYGDNSVKLAPGDLARLRRANRAILEKYGVTEQEESPHA